MTDKLPRCIGLGHIALAADFLLRAAFEGEQQLVEELFTCQVTSSQIALTCIDNWVNSLHGTRIDIDQLISLMGDLDTEPAERATAIIMGLQADDSKVRSLVPVLFDEFGEDQQMVTEVALSIIAGYHRDRQRDAT